MHAEIKINPRFPIVIGFITGYLLSEYNGNGIFTNSA